MEKFIIVIVGLPFAFLVRMQKTVHYIVLHSEIWFQPPQHSFVLENFRVLVEVYCWHCYTTVSVHQQTQDRSKGSDQVYTILPLYLYTSFIVYTTIKVTTLARTSEETDR